MTLDIATSLESPVVRTVLGAIAAGLLYVLGRELRKIPAKLTVLMATAFLDMVGLLIVVPILPFYARRLGGEGFNIAGIHFGIGSVVAHGQLCSIRNIERITSRRRVITKIELRRRCRASRRNQRIHAHVGHSKEPHGAARNVWPATVEGLDDEGDRVRVRLSEPTPLVVEITRGGSAALSLLPGARVWAALKASEITLQPD